MNQLYRGKLVSVIVPVFNCEKYIRKCLTSILEQTYHNIEILVVNDGSSDGSQNIINDLARMDARICSIAQENQGVAAARNHALSCARGDYYVFVDGDDYIGATFIECLVECAEKKQSELVICGYTLVYADKKKNKVVIPGVYIKDKKEEWAYRISSVWGRMYSSTFWKGNGLKFVTEKEARAEDVPIDLFANVMARNVCVIKNAEYYYVQHEGSAMNNNSRVLFYFPYIAFEEMYSRVRNAKLTNSRAYFDIGVLKFLAQFKYVIYRRVAGEEKGKFEEYIKKLLKNDIVRMKEEWKMLCHDIDLPLAHKVAISFLLKQLGKDCHTTNV